MTMLLSDMPFRRASDPFTGQAGQRVGLTPTIQPIRQTRLSSASTNQHRRCEGVVTSRGTSFPLRESIRHDPVDQRRRLKSEIGQGIEYWSRINGSQSRDNRTLVTTPRRSESLRTDYDYTPPWQNEQRWQQIVSSYIQCIYTENMSASSAGMLCDRPS